MNPVLELDIRFPPSEPRVEVDGFRLAEAEKLVLFGPNGAGKSTLLRVLAGIIHEAEVPAAAYLPQAPWMFRGTAGQNLDFGLSADGRVLARAVAADLGVNDLGLRARQLSGGEAQRVAIARVLARGEEVVLLDEPLAAVDLRDRAEVAGIIRRRLDGRAAVIVTHDRDDAAILGDAMAVMLDGRIVQRGPVADVFAQPVDEAVADVVGVANVLVGDAAEVDGSLVSVDAGDLRVWGLGDAPTGGSARAMFGGETVTILPAGSAVGSARNSWTGRIRDVRRLGRLLEVVIDVGHPIVAIVTPGAADALDMSPGAEVVVSVKATAVRVVGGD